MTKKKKTRKKGPTVADCVKALDAHTKSIVSQQEEIETLFSKIEALEKRVNLGP